MKKYFKGPIRSAVPLVIVASVLSITLMSRATADERSRLDPPTFRVQKVGELHRVMWRLPRGLSERLLRRMTLIIERGTELERYTPRFVIEQPPRRGSTFDTPVAGSLNMYRARIVGRSNASPWSTVTWIDVAPPSQSTHAQSTEPVQPVLTSFRFASCSSVEVEDAFSRVNDKRRQHGVPPLRFDLDLATSAAQHSSEMAEDDELSHSGWLDNIRAAGFDGEVTGQNIAVGFSTGARVSEAWFGSEKHLQNLLSSLYDRSGMGCVVDAHGRSWWTQNFGWSSSQETR
jgi:uncharacterized protein YkwD